MSIIEPWFSVEDVAGHLQVSNETVYHRLRKDKIPAHCVGKQWRFKPSAEDEWVKSSCSSDSRRVTK
jgi:excisionase family DNA binding protein